MSWMKEDVACHRWSLTVLPVRLMNPPVRRCSRCGYLPKPQGAQENVQASQIDAGAFLESGILHPIAAGHLVALRTQARTLLQVAASRRG